MMTIPTKICRPLNKLVSNFPNRLNPIKNFSLATVFHEKNIIVEIKPNIFVIFFYPNFNCFYSYVSKFLE